MCHQGSYKEYKTVLKAKEFVKKATTPFCNSPHSNWTPSFPYLEENTSFPANVPYTLTSYQYTTVFLCYWKYQKRIADNLTEY